MWHKIPKAPVAWNKIGNESGEKYSCEWMLDGHT